MSDDARDTTTTTDTTLDGWTAPTVLGPVPSFHLDPVVGGPPLVSPDGHWRWDGEAWRPRTAA